MSLKAYSSNIPMFRKTPVFECIKHTYTRIAVVDLKDEAFTTLYDTTGSVQEGVEIFGSSESGYFNAVLMDIRMPIMDGLTAAKTIHPETLYATLAEWMVNVNPNIELDVDEPRRGSLS